MLVCCPVTPVGLMLGAAFMARRQGDSTDQFVLPLRHVSLARLAALYQLGRVRSTVFEDAHHLPPRGVCGNVFASDRGPTATILCNVSARMLTIVKDGFCRKLNARAKTGPRMNKNPNRWMPVFALRFGPQRSTRTCQSTFHASS